MKVICIDGEPRVKDAPTLPEGVVLEASQCPVYENNYDIAGYEFCSTGIPVSHSKIRFVPLSDTDEMDLLEQRKVNYKVL